MRMMVAILGAMLAAPLAAQEPQIRFGPVFEEFGPHYPVEGIDRVPEDAEFAVAQKLLHGRVVLRIVAALAPEHRADRVEPGP